MLIEPEVHIIEKYFQEILHCFTMTNIRCKGGKEIDLLAIDTKTNEKYHVESRVGTSPSFKIREKDTYTSKGRAHKIGLDYFQNEKFEHPIIVQKIHELFGETSYNKILVVWDVEDLSLKEIAKKKYGFDLWFMDELLNDMINSGIIKGSRDDILRVIEFISLLEKNHFRRESGALKRRQMRGIAR